MSSTRTWRSRPAILGLALALLALQAAGLVHMAFVRHTLCTHGLWVDAARAPRPLSVRSTSGRSATSDPEDTSAEVDGEHDHCAIPTQLRTPRLAPSASRLPTSVPEGLRFVGGGGLPKPVQCLLHIAPKQGPPALAQG